MPTHFKKGRRKNWHRRWCPPSSILPSCKLSKSICYHTTTFSEICTVFVLVLVILLFCIFFALVFNFVLDVRSSSVCTGKCSFFRCVSISYCDQWPLWVISWSKLEIVIFPCLTFDKKAKNLFHALSSTFTQCWLNFSFISHWRVAVGQIRLNQMYLETGSTLIGREHTFLS